MKKFFGFGMAVLLLLTAMFVLSACAPQAETVVITAEEVAEGTTLLQYMEQMQKEKKISFRTEESSGMVMITAINGIGNAGNSYWMLYTDDAENSDETWGTIEVEGKKYASAKVGAGELVLKKGCTYVWKYETMNG